MRTEELSQKKLRADTGVWIEQFLTLSLAQRPEMSYGYGAPAGTPTPPPMMNTGGRVLSPAELTQMAQGRAVPAPAEAATPEGVPAGTPAAAAAGLATEGASEISTIKITCRAVDLKNVAPDANQAVFYPLETELRASPMFDSKGTELDPRIVSDETTGTFTFGITAMLKNPLKL